MLAEMKPLILMTGHTFEDLRADVGDFDAWFARGSGWSRDRFEVIDAVAAPPLPDPASVDPVIVTGSPLHVHHREPWSVRAGEWLRDVVEAGIPVLGVCYGHQLLGDVYGGDVGPNPNGREIGVVEVDIDTEHPLFHGLPSSLPVFQTHTDAVNRAPQGWKTLAGNALTPVQAMEFGSALTVQWHPEFTVDILRHYISRRIPLLDAELGAGAADRILANLRHLPDAPAIIRNFLRMCS